MAGLREQEKGKGRSGSSREESSQRIKMAPSCTLDGSNVHRLGISMVAFYQEVRRYWERLTMM